MSNPNHIAIIMDGNGRWAKQRGYLERTKGHEQGAKTVREIATHAAKIGVKSLTLYAFSTENWKRPKSEVDFLMKMLENYLEKELDTLLANNIKFSVIGDIEKFSDKLKNRINLTVEATKNAMGLNQILALNYGGKDEIIRSIKKLIDSKKEINEANLNNQLDLNYEIDLLIRTGGEKRISNFLLWQSAYAELFFSDTLWPEFTTTEFDKIIEEFKVRERRFGGL